MAQQPVAGLCLLYRGFTIIQLHTTVVRTPLYEGSARRRDLYLTTQNTHKRQTYITPAGFKPTIPVSGRPQTHALDRVANGICSIVINHQKVWWHHSLVFTGIYLKHHISYCKLWKWIITYCRPLNQAELNGRLQVQCAVIHRRTPVDSFFSRSLIGL
jgi:hypothetical protein